MALTVVELGDVVQLKSGGPAMTVEEIETADDTVRTLWFDDKQILQEGWFNLRSVTKSF